MFQEVILIVITTLCVVANGALSATDQGVSVIYAINAGGDIHTDVNGVMYDRDPLMGDIGTSSDYGRQLLMIGRVSPQDEILYQTERYHTSTFGYDIPTDGDGDYALVLKFCEVYFSGANMKVFDIVLNGDHTVVSDLDIYQQAGKGVAHDEVIYFSVSRGRLYYKEEESEIRGGKIRCEFIKGYRDNPKINAIVLFMGDVDHIPKLPAIVTQPDALEATDAEQLVHSDKAKAKVVEPTVVPVAPIVTDPVQSSDDYEFIERPSTKARKTSGPKQPNPYSLDDSSVMLPVFIAIAAFIPLMFCLCKL